MDWKDLLFNFEGRINRAKWWLAVLIIVVFTILISVVLLPLIGLSMMTASESTVGTLFSIVLTAVIGYPTTAVMMKRLNDRERPHWLVYVFWAPTVVNLLAQLFGLTVSMQNIGGLQEVMMPTTLGWIIQAISLPIGIWALVELGILKGTEGSNSHGPDPLAKS